MPRASYYNADKTKMELGLYDEGAFPSYKFVVATDPRPKQRPRFNRVTKRVFTPAASHHYQNVIREMVVLSLAETHGFTAKDFPVYDVTIPLQLSLDFFFELPTRHPGQKQKSTYLGPRWVPKLSDVDNLAKAVMDGLNKILWEDDRQVVRLIVNKMYASRPVREGDDIQGLEHVDKQTHPRVCILVEPAGLPPDGPCTT